MASSSQSCETLEEVSGGWRSPSEDQGRARNLTLIEGMKAMRWAQQGGDVPAVASTMPAAPGSSSAALLVTERPAVAITLSLRTHMVF